MANLERFSQFSIPWRGVFLFAIVDSPVNRDPVLHPAFPVLPASILNLEAAR